jgi:hypothetical protein
LTLTASDKRLRRIYKITKAEQDKEIKRQGGGCAICGRPFPKFKAFQDHYHGCCPRKMKEYCGRCTRGQLCFLCNKYLVGVLERQGIDPNRVAAYINKWTEILRTRGVYDRKNKN